ncbi:MAG: hypothetical protein AAF666_14560 [Pseudomonadota bacterium]
MDLTVARVLIPQVGVLLALVLLTLWLVRPPDQLDALFSHQECRRVDLKDPETGDAITGAEDLQFGPDGDRVYLSAYDRSNLERSGGLYAFSLWEWAGREELTAKKLNRDQTRVFHPHGFALSTNADRLAVVVRDTHGGATIEVGELDPSGWKAGRVLSSPALCRANDLQFSGADDTEIEVTIDRADCAPSLRDLLPGARTGKVLRFSHSGPDVVRQGLRFPNGLASGVVAETRADRLSWEDGRRVDLPGGPDNLTEMADGRLVVAVHPNLFLTFLGSRGIYGATPSRVLLVDPNSLRITVLFDDPEGRIFAGATAALFDGSKLVVGSATDTGLLICEKRP